MYLVQHDSFIVCSGEVTVGEDTSGPALDVSGSYFCPLHIFVVASTSYYLQACLQVIEKYKKQNKVVFATSAVFWERNIDEKD